MDEIRSESSCHPPQLPFCCFTHPFFSFFFFFTLFGRTHGTAGSFRTTFLLLSFVVMVLRGVLVLVPFKHWSFFCLSFFYLILPIYLQFVTFTLLIVFFQKCLLVIKRQGARVRGCLYPTYLGTCVGLLFFCIILAGVITWLAPTYAATHT